MAVELTRVSKKYNEEVIALENVSFKIKKVPSRFFRKFKISRLVDAH